MRIRNDKAFHGWSGRTLSAAALFVLLSLCFIISARAATGSESIIFLHHSTGGNLYSQGGVASWLANYNAGHGTAYQITERSYPNSPYPWKNYPYDYWHLWVDQACDSATAGIECLNSLALNHNVIIFKHCFPGAGIQADTGNPDITSENKTLENYKLQYRALRNLMDGYPQNVFIVWTLAPLHRLATDVQQAQRAKQFVDWVKNDWLNEDAQAHANIHIFDFWGYAAEDNPTPANGQVNTLRYAYENDHSDSDSHPNQLANETIGPLFAQFIVDTIENQTSNRCTPENILCVPAEYASVNAAAAAAQDGDRIEIEAGTYTGTGIVATVSADNVSIIGVNGRAGLDAHEVVISNAKAILVTTGDNITIENIEFSNAQVPDQNGAGIRHEGGLLTIRNCYFHDNQDGLLTSNQANGRLVVENTEFNHNGLGEAGYTHNIYVGHIAGFTMQYSYSHHATHGHNLKSRAAENHILYNRIMDETTGNASYQIDIPNGGLTYIIGNTIHQGLNAENSAMISYAAEGADNPVQELYVSGNTLANDRASGTRGIRLAGTPTAIVVNNIFDNIEADYAVDGQATVFTGNIVGSENHFEGRSNFDFHLTADSPAIGAAGDPGAYHGISLSPLVEYVHPLNSKPRETVGQPDAGAFEYAAGTADDPPPDDPPGTDPGTGSNEDSGNSGSGCLINSLLSVTFLQAISK